jgi:cell division protein FtsI (penicillin-binding protein 3)
LSRAIARRPGVPVQDPELGRHVTIRRRVLVLALVFACWGTAIEARLMYLQVYRRSELSARAERQQKRTIEVPAKRGEILDRQGRVLAYSVDADSIYAVPPEIDNPHRTVAALCRVLRDCSRQFRVGVLERMRKQRAFVWVRRQVSPDEAREVEKLNLEGIGMLKETRRYYPNTSIAAHVLGYVGMDNTGLSGIELSYDRYIRGKPGTALVQTDARRHAFSRTERPPTTGSTVELTIDQVLQWIAERELKAGIAQHRAVSGTVIIMDPWTGEILAMANEPTFNPNVFGRAKPAALRNRAIQDIYEPGSTFKVVTASAALEENVIDPSDPVDVSQGYIRIGSRQIDDVHRYETLSFTDVIVKSSNVGAIKVGLRLGGERLNRYVRRFGFGRTLSPDLNGEEGGIVWSQLNDSALASVSMGYQIGVTALQMATAVSSVANGGHLIEPRLVRAIDGPGGRLVIPPKTLRRTIEEKTAAELTAIMEEVVDRGTAQTAKIEGFTIAGKTGTSAKLVNHAYSKSDYMSSFVGFVPSRKPVATILVVIDSPRGGYYGGVVAAPVFKRIAEATLRHLGVPPTINPPPAVMVKRDRQVPAEQTVSGPVVSPLVHTASDSLPDLRGLGAREALSRLTRLGIRPRIRGTGVVVTQKPEAGTPLEDVERVDLRLGRPPGTTATPFATAVAGVGGVRQ